MTWPAAWRRSTRREVVAALLLAVGLTGFVVLVYVVVVLGGGALVGRTPPDLLLSVVATFLVTLAFDPVQSSLERLVARVVHGGARAPYEVWERFSATVTGTFPADELPSRMAHVLAEGTGARGAEVWLVVQDRPVLAATWPPDLTTAATPDEAPGRRSLPVRHGGERLGVLVVQEGAPLTAVEERLFAGLADQAGLVLRSTRLRAELGARFEELARQAKELRTSRMRVVAAQDERRRVLERDIHDGAQQHLVALAVNLRLALVLQQRDPTRAERLLREQEEATERAIETLVRLSRGIYPPVLAAEGLVPALATASANSPVRVLLSTRDVARYDAPVEAAAYFTCLEALQNAAKHAAATTVRVEVTGRPDTLVLRVEDDGRGFDVAQHAGGVGLANLRDRVESVGGVLTTESAPGQGTCVEARFPARARPRTAAGV